MPSQKVWSICISVALWGSLATAYGAKTPPALQKTLQVEQFTMTPGVTVSDKYMQAMMKDTVKRLTNTRHFQTVILGDTVSLPSTAPAILLKGQLLEYSPGKRATRMLASGGLIGYSATGGGRAGEATARVHIQFVDSASGKVLYEHNIEAVVRGKPFDMNPKHTFGPSAKETEQIMAKKIASVAKSDFP